MINDTLEEIPMIYKKEQNVLEYIRKTVEVEQRLRQHYNFKAAD